MFIFPAVAARANHIFGGELLYTHISGNLYKISLTLYGDCSSLNTPNNPSFLYLPNAIPRILIYDTTSLNFDSLFLKLEPGYGIEVSPVCPGQISNTYCNGGNLPGVKKFVYSDTITLHPSREWRFIFNGILGNGYTAGRSNSITNINPPTTMQIMAMLNNKYQNNSSPIYSTIPTPFYCVNVLQQYNQGATDNDGDSLSFSLAQALDGTYGSPAGYVYLYSGTHPLATLPGDFSFSPITGQITFKPNILQKSLVVGQVNEYRHGVLVGTSQREMTFIVQDNCDGTPPVASISSISGGVVSTGNIINICLGQPSVNFTVSLSNPDGEITDITAANVPATATLVVNNDHTVSPSVNFSWATGSLPVGSYTFYLTIKNNHCPLINTQTVAYTIKVAAPPVLQVQQTSITNCIYPAGITYTINYGFAPRNIIISESGTPVKTIVDNTAGDTVIVKDSLPAGHYTVVVRSDLLCVDSVSFTIVDTGNLPISPVTESYCRGDGTLPIVITPIVPGAVINWYSTDSTPLPGAPVVSTASENVFQWYFIETYNVCSSGPVTVTATVHQLPQGQILNIPQTICYGDAIYLKASGGTSYTWEPATEIKHDTGGYYIEVLNPVTVVVNITDQFGCKDTAGVTFADIQDCCRFSYPNAFTPNNDGNNDGFRIVTWGNMRSYALTIFNRWGQPVFFTADPKKAWDGTFNGEPCEIGTYYYYLKAECLTGPKEWHKGDVILIR